MPIVAVQRNSDQSSRLSTVAQVLRGASCGETSPQLTRVEQTGKQYEIHRARLHRYRRTQFTDQDVSESAPVCPSRRWHSKGHRRRCHMWVSGLGTLCARHRDRGHPPKVAVADDCTWWPRSLGVVGGMLKGRSGTAVAPASQTRRSPCCRAHPTYRPRAGGCSSRYCRTEGTSGARRPLGQGKS